MWNTHERCWTVIGYPKWHPKHKPLYKGRGGGPGSYAGSNNSNQGYPMGRTRRFAPNRTTATVQGDNEKYGSTTLTVQQLEQIIKNLPGVSNIGRSTIEMDDDFDSNPA